MNESDAERFSRKFAKASNGCWIWTAAVCRAGYGHMRVAGVLVGAHRLAYEHWVSPIPAGHGYHGTCVCHRCDTPSCVNPDHLFLGTMKDNNVDKSKKKRGNAPRNERHGKVRTSDAVVAEIRESYHSGKENQMQLSRRFGVSQPVISQWVRNVVRNP